MCCFSRPVKSVSNTKIFCRVGPKGSQVVIYSMRLDADEDLAMILPIPVVAASPENAVKFLDFSDYSGFFDDLEKGFPTTRREDTFGILTGRPRGSKKLKVSKVGSFDASFVPTVADFSRLDERFRLPDDVWKKLPQYADYGFVVFKLRKGEAQIHPMGFTYPTRNRTHLTFPTVHIHDGMVHKTAEFDHSLYCQSPSYKVAIKWRESDFPAEQFVKCSKAHGTVLPKEHIFKGRIKGILKNVDAVAATAENDQAA